MVSAPGGSTTHRANASRPAAEIANGRRSLAPRSPAVTRPASAIQASSR